MSDVTEAAPAAPADSVAFVIGGQPIPVKLLSLADAKRAGLLHPDLIARAERAIEVVAVLAAAPDSALAALYTKDNLMAACSAGEALGLLDSMRELMTRSGFPAAPATPPAAASPTIEVVPPEAETVPAVAESSPNFTLAAAPYPAA